jgi:8-oxo-dGTP diphosphatase
MEPHKCPQWNWTPWSEMWKLAKEQADCEAKGLKVEVPMFLPLVNLVKDYPEMEHHF